MAIYNRRAAKHNSTVKTIAGRGRCSICGANLGSAISAWERHRKHCRQPFSWSAMKEAMSKILINEEFSRSRLKEDLGIPLGSGGNAPHETTMDNYRNWLTQAGYLKKSIKRGTYVKIRHIPADLTSTQLYKEAYT
jgi:hypothetical protein